VPPASCTICGSRLPKKGRFCPECGTRVGASAAETAVQEIPEQKTGPVPIDVMTAEPRFFGLVRRLPDTPVARLSLGAMSAVRAHAGLTVEAVTVHSSARVSLFRQRRELVELFGLRTDAARALGEAVYAGDKVATKAARARMKELDGLIAAKEEAMQETAAGAMERIQHAQLQVQPTQIETPEPPTPEPSPEPAPVPEPSPEPSEPPGPVVVPEPGPAPSPPATPQ
jgi:hypothetical protein